MQLATLDTRKDEAWATAPVLEGAPSNAFRYLWFIAAIAAYIIPLLRLCPPDSDEGILVVGAVRTLHGQLLGRDFVEVIGPGTFYWIAAFLRVFGESFFATRVCLFVTTMVAAWAIYTLTRRICNSWRVLPTLLVLASYFNTFWPEMSHHGDSNCFALLGLVCLISWLKHEKSWLLALAGSLIGATALTLQQKGAYLFLGVSVWLLLKHAPGRQRLQRLTIFCLGFLVPLLGTALYFWKRGALYDLIYATVIWPQHNYGRGFGVHYAFLLERYFTQWLVPGMRWTYATAALLFVPYLFTAALPLFVVVAAVGSRCTRQRPEVLLYWVAGAALWLSEIHRADIAHLVMGSPLLVILAVYYLQLRRNRIRGYILQTIAICTVCLMLASQCVSLVAQPITTRAGRVWFARRPASIQAIEEHVPDGSDLFIYPIGLMDYFLSRTNNPTRYSSCTFNVLYGSTLQQDQIIADLDRRHVRFVLWNKDLGKTLDEALHSGGSLSRIDLGPYLNTHYRVIWSGNDVYLLERIGLSSDAPASSIRLAGQAHH